LTLPIPYDQSFKLLADDDPRAALAVFAGIPLDADIEVETVDRELNVPTLRVDNLYRCRQDGVEFLVHFEAVSRFRAGTLDRQADYVRAIVTKYKLPCRSYLLLLTESGVPARLPHFLEFRFGDYACRVKLRAVRLWKIPAHRVLRMGRLSLSPWVVLMQTEAGQLMEAGRRLVAARNGGLTAQMALLAGLRYGTKELFEERLARMTTEEIIEDSYFYQWVMEKGEKKGERIGRAKLLIEILSERFGSVPESIRDRISTADSGKLKEWVQRAGTAKSLEECLR